MPSKQHQMSEPEPGARLASDILQATLDPLLALDNEGKVNLANTAFYEAFSLKESEVLGQRLDRISGGLGDIPDLWDLLQKVQETGESFKNYEVTHQFQSLGRRTMLLNACRIHTHTGRDDALILLGMKDVTDLREAQEAQRRNEQTLRMIFENAQQFAIIGMDMEGRVTAWNAGAEQLLGYTTEEMLGDYARIIFTPEDRAQGKPESELKIALDQGRAENERWHVRKDGSRFWGSGLVTPLYDDEGQVQGLLKIMRDMTAQHRLREEREARARELEQRVAEATAESNHRATRLEEVTRHLHEVEQRERRRLARVLHDDLQQLLVATKMRLQLVENETRSTESLQETRRLVDQAIETTRSLSHELSPSVLWDRGFVPALYWLAQSVEARYQLPVRVHVESEEKVSSRVTATVGEPIYQMVRELLFNVVKHAEASEARVVVKPIGDEGLHLEVEDNGIGCEAAVMSGEGEEGGHGLGLRGIRERLLIWQGQMNCDPRPHHGCNITLNIPKLSSA